MARVEIVELTDPGCSWAWGTEPKLRLLRWRYGDRTDWRRVLGGLVGDMASYVPGFEPVAAAAIFTQYWANVCATTGMPHPATLQWMYRSTEPACLAVHAAAAQGHDVATLVLRRLREATFVRGCPPDTPERIARALRGAPVDVDRLLADMDSPAVAAAFRADWEEARRPNDYVRTLEDNAEASGRARQSEGHWRYAFPTLLMRGPGGERTVPGWRDYQVYVDAMEAVAPGISAGPRPDPTPEELMTLSRSAAQKEIDFCCGAAARAPRDAVAYERGGGVLWLDREVAEAWEDR
jgi:predicted DsbA family dithiol-disulfide isomerase